MPIAGKQPLAHLPPEDAKSLGLICITDMWHPGGCSEMNRDTVHLEQGTSKERAERLVALPPWGQGFRCLAVGRVLTGGKNAEALPSPTGLLR